MLLLAFSPRPLLSPLYSLRRTFQFCATLPLLPLFSPLLLLIQNILLHLLASVVPLSSSIAFLRDVDPAFGPSGSGSVSQRYRSRSFYHQAKIVRKPLITTVLWLLHDFLSLKNDVNVHSKSNKQKNFCLVLKVTDENSRTPPPPNPDPGPDP